MKWSLLRLVALTSGLFALQSTAIAQPALVVKTLTEKKVTALPAVHEPGEPRGIAVAESSKRG